MQNQKVKFYRDFHIQQCMQLYVISQVTHNDKDTWTLVIKNVRQKDGGEYMCQVNSVPMVSQVLHLFEPFCRFIAFFNIFVDWKKKPKSVHSN